MCVECDLAEPESLASLGGSAPGVVDGILSPPSLYHRILHEILNNYDHRSPMIRMTWGGGGLYHTKVCRKWKILKYRIMYQQKQPLPCQPDELHNIQDIEALLDYMHSMS